MLNENLYYMCRTVTKTFKLQYRHFKKILKILKSHRSLLYSMVLLRIERNIRDNNYGLNHSLYLNNFSYAFYSKKFHMLRFMNHVLVIANWRYIDDDVLVIASWGFIEKTLSW